MSEKRDYYEVLGVDRSTAPADMKKAYRKLALKLHPDRNPDDPAAEDQFKECSEAFQVLNDPEKRRMYDQFGHAGMNQAGYSGFSDVQDIFGSLGDIFGDLFGGFSGGGGGRGRRRSPGRAGASVRTAVEITLEEAAFGCKKEFEVSHPVPCTDCNGSGAEGGKRTTCPMCAGQGQVAQNRGMFVLATTCGQCRGAGSIAASPCRECEGQGQVHADRMVKISVPSGIDDGQTLRLRGEGQPGFEGGPPGDLLCTIQVEDDERFQRDGFDLIHELRISYPEAVLGTRTEVPTLGKANGDATVKVPRGTQPGHAIIVENEGVPLLNGRGRGNLIALVQVEVPHDISPRAKELLEELGRELKS